MDILQKIEKTKKYILSRSGFKAGIAVIAGSGLGQLKEEFEIIKTIKYSKIPYFAKTTVSGHAGELNFCSHKGTKFLIFSGRFHYYEGHSAQDVVYPVRIMNALGVKTVIITAAAGGINKKYKHGDIVVLKDHINFTGNNPLIGTNIDGLGERFPEMTEIYDLKLRNKSIKTAKKLKIKAYEGVYFGVTGPSYETAAEVDAYRKLGGDIVGMSVVYEAIAAAHMKMKVLGISYVSNMAAGINKTRLNHQEVLETGKKTGLNMTKIIKGVLEDIK
ncbi:MAG: purine-nucleoside phosphorylase [Endomicrobia bacterium]|nr:purine-nucleoside phosphorylase [Endomicrobiia bacterium]MCL2145499.1 purine-nucleoside phosphorylase [Endomicrobiia bacterium]